MKKLIVALLMFPMATMGQDAPLECDNNYGECGTPEMSGGGNQGGGGAILINNTDLGDTYQSADDYDDDGVEDSYDNCPRQRNSEQFDSDGDGVGDLCDNCRDTHNQNQWDLDGDGEGDLCDPDMDGDGVLNHQDNCLRSFNRDQSDIDGDEEGDACDRDIDNDGLDNLTDPCPMHVGDPTEDAEWCSPDIDGDGVPDYGFSADNCPGIHNPFQYDTDLDGAGDACDPDLDGDGVGNLQDNCNGVFNHEQRDADRDGRGDEGCDDHFCFVVFGDEENCLDPTAATKVYSPGIIVNTGDTAILRMFTNKPDVNLSFVWSVKERMGGSRDTIENPIGESSESILFERVISNRSTFSPKIPGKYILNIAVEFEDGRTAQHDVEVLVGGSVIPYSTSGCNIGLNQKPGLNSIHLLFILLLFPGMIRRFKKCMTV